MAVPLTLKVFKGDVLVATRDYDRDIIKIGRLSSAHLCLDDEKVSRIHSVIEVAPDGRLSIIDMGSVEGTYVNGKRVNKGAIAVGDEIKVGNTTIKVESTTDAAAPNLQPAVRTEPVTEVTQVGAPPQQATAPRAEPAPVLAPAAVVAAPVVHPPRAPSAPQPLDDTFAPTEQNSTLGHGGKDEGTASRRRPERKKGTGPVGLEVRFMWGTQMVGEYFLHPGKPSTFSVGTAADVNFIMGDAKLDGPKFDVIHSDGHSFQVRFNGKMNGELQRQGETFELKTLAKSGKASNEGDANAVTLQADDFIWVDLGAVTVEVCQQPVPKAVFVPFLETVDYTALNIMLAMFFIGGLFVVSALNREAEGDAFADELSADNQNLVKLLIKPPDEQKNPFLQKLAKEKAAEVPAAHSGAEGQMGRKDTSKKDGRTAPKAIDKNSKDMARLMAAKIFGKGGGGIASIFGHAGLGGELQAAMGHMTGTQVGDANGLGGLGLRGGGGGGGGTGNTIGIGAVGTKGTAGGNEGYGTGAGIMGAKKMVDIGITSGQPETDGSIDKEAIRRVIRSHADQIRYCYELQLPSHPRLGGKIAVKFIITGNGTVATSSVAQTTVNNPDFEQCVAGRVKTWLFPKPKGGGTAVVTYPFVFKQSGD